MAVLGFSNPGGGCCQAADKLRSLEKKLARQKALMESRRLRWRREKALLLAKLRKLDHKAVAATKLQESGTLSSQQVRRLATGKRVRIGL
ncbi:hypothetical protein FJT64_020060 [Amphibalanus amphitrite]|uniref:Uncharacterized protein n=1 Tax=Amphibalanus amphitrite TaxID=1232801 RepID=A0A6A4WY60_AMPAM|nr:hypothetical protein FJT64_020060 [Amphibalanus amphitrite]